MDDGACAALFQEGCILLDAVIGFELEAPPSCPRRRANAVLGEHWRDLVGLGCVVERCNAEAELHRNVDHDRHLVGAIAVVLNEDFAIQHTGQRLHAQVAIGRRALAFGGGLQLPGVLRGLDPGCAVAGHVAHARGWLGALVAIDPFRVLAAGHLEPVGCPRELHGLHGRGRHVLERDRPPAKQVRGTGQDHQRGHAAAARCIEPLVLWPDRMFGPDFSRVG